MWILFPQNTRNPFVKLKITRGCDIKTYIQKTTWKQSKRIFLLPNSTVNCRQTV